MKVPYIVSKDGTIILASDCIRVELTPEQLDALAEMADSERFRVVQAFLEEI